MKRRPVVIADGALQQLQSNDNLDISLEEEFDNLQREFRTLLCFLAGQGFEFPESLQLSMAEG